MWNEFLFIIQKHFERKENNSCIIVVIDIKYEFTCFYRKKRVLPFCHALKYEFDSAVFVRLPLTSL